MELSSRYPTLVGINNGDFTDQKTGDLVKGFYFHLVYPGNKYMDGYRTKKPIFVSAAKVEKCGMPVVGDKLILLFNSYQKLERYEVVQDAIG